ncbi:hypothetical protein BEH94_06255 [Candidatus Altiarchaeales archaeon WOR_SM1_SCG]|nr:hypothetical protein BEH94_06255 [Candidatus Altiarchaeales archaeon WOR_SM1_SCG]
MKCALCENKICYEGKDCTKIKDNVISEYLGKENKKIMETASKIEAKGYMKLTRLEELIMFCKEMNFKKVGIAFCIGLEEEAKILHKILEKNFDVYSVCCKVCGIDKEKFGLKKIKEARHEVMCDPIGQATILNDCKTDLNIIFGLCIGHDILFSKYSNAPVTTLLVKDRVLAHNPAGVFNKYYRSKLKTE